MAAASNTTGPDRPFWITVTEHLSDRIEKGDHVLIDPSKASGNYALIRRPLLGAAAARLERYSGQARRYIVGFAARVEKDL